MKFIHPSHVKQQTIDKYKGFCVESANLIRHKGGGLEWTGSVVGENYFKIGYLNGILAINIADRESQLYSSGDFIGELKDYNVQKITSVEDLIKFLSQKETKKPEFSFDDILEFLGWTKTDTFEVMEFIT